MQGLRSLIGPKQSSTSARRSVHKSLSNIKGDDHQSVSIRITTEAAEKAFHTKRNASVMHLQTNQTNANGTPIEELKTAKNRFKQLLLKQQQSNAPDFPPKQIENMLANKASEQLEIAANHRFKLNIEDRYSDEGDFNSPRQIDNDAVRTLDKWQLENKKRARKHLHYSLCECL